MLFCFILLIPLIAIPSRFKNQNETTVGTFSKKKKSISDQIANNIRIIIKILKTFFINKNKNENM